MTGSPNDAARRKGAGGGHATPEEHLRRRAEAELASQEKPA